MTPDEMLQRMRAGEILRFVPRRVYSGSDDYMDGIRDCYLGKQKLTSEESESVIHLDMAGIIQNKKDCIGVLVYELVEPSAPKGGE